MPDVFLFKESNIYYWRKVLDGTFFNLYFGWAFYLMVGTLALNCFHNNHKVKGNQNKKTILKKPKEKQKKLRL